MNPAGLRVVVAGLLAQYPMGGMAWHYLQYLIGLKRLGHDVYYLEDTGQWPYNPVEDGTGTDCEYNVAYLNDLMASVGLPGRWMYRFCWGPQWYGLDDNARAEVLESADLLVDVSGTLERPERYRHIPRLIYIDTDPVFTQIRLAKGQADVAARVDVHDAHFSFGETLAECGIPTDRRWRPTRQPIVLSEWDAPQEGRDAFTTIMNWTSYKTVEYEGRSFGQKDIELRRFIELPGRISPTVVEIAMSSGKTKRVPRELLEHKRWRLVAPAAVCPDIAGYRSYIQSSMGEWTVAKNAYVEGRAGWFSERSACYLAAGRPVVTQSTGFEKVLPVGQGLLSFTSLEEAADAIHDVCADYSRHSDAARDLAHEYFDSDKVLSHLLENAFTL